MFDKDWWGKSNIHRNFNFKNEWLIEEIHKFKIKENKHDKIKAKWLKRLRKILIKLQEIRQHQLQSLSIFQIQKASKEWVAGYVFLFLGHVFNSYNYDHIQILLANTSFGAKSIWNPSDEQSRLQTSTQRKTVKLMNLITCSCYVHVK